MKAIHFFFILIFLLFVQPVVLAQKIISFTTNSTTYFPGDTAYFFARIENEEEPLADYKSVFMIMKTSEWEYTSIPGDTIVYTEYRTLSLQPNEEKTIELQWKIPYAIEPGIYRAYYRIKSPSGISKGFLTELFEIKDIGQEVKAVRLWDLEFYYKDEVGSALEGLNVDPNSNFSIQFFINNTGDTVLNLKIRTNFTYTFEPSKSAFVKEDTLTLNPAEVRKVVISIISPSKPTSYTPIIQAISDNEILGELRGRVVVKGYGATILDAHTDKFAYIKGELVKIEVEVIGSADYESEIKDVELNCKILKKSKEILSDRKILTIGFNPQKVLFSKQLPEDLVNYTLYCNLKKDNVILHEFHSNYIGGELLRVEIPKEEKEIKWVWIPILFLIGTILLLLMFIFRRKKETFLLLTLLIFLPTIVTADCRPKDGFLCCPSRCPMYEVNQLDGNLQVKDANNDGFFEPGEDLIVTFETVLPGCINSVDMLRVKLGLYDENNNLIKTKTALYSTIGHGNYLVEYVATLKVPLDIAASKIEVRLVANTTVLHASTAARKNAKEAFDSCVLKVLGSETKLEELPLNDTVINDLKNTKDSEKLPYTIDTEDIYINKNKFTLRSGAGFPYWIFSAYDLAKCLYNWENCMKRANTECICCSNLGGYYGKEARGEWRKTYDTILFSPYITSLSYTGDENYFNIFWNATYEAKLRKKINVKCILNEQQSCEHSHLSGMNGSCSIINPQYNFKTDNVLKCIAYNPLYPKANSTNTSLFKAIDFQTFLGIKFGQSFIVGEANNVPVYVRNLGLLSDVYNITYEVFPNPNFLFVELPSYQTERTKTNEVKDVIAKVTLSGVAESINLKFCANSTTHPPYCSYNDNREQKCCQTVQINAGLASLQDITFKEILKLLLLASIILLLFKRH